MKPPWLPNFKVLSWLLETCPHAAKTIRKLNTKGRYKMYCAVWYSLQKRT